MARYLDPKADLTFKKIFGEHSDLVASLLNALLPLPEDSKVTSVEYLTPEVVPDDPLHKDSIVDVRCKDQLGRQFVVEMQMIWTADYNQRVLFNAAKAYVRQLPAGGGYGELKTVYSLNLLNEIVNPGIPNYYHHYMLKHSEYKGKTIDGIQIVFVELPKFSPQTYIERKMRVLWLRFLTEINENTRKVPAELEANPDVKKALDMVEESALNEAERARYDGFVDWLRRERRRAKSEQEYDEKVAQLQAVKARLDATSARLDATSAQLETAKVQLDAKVAQLDATSAQLETAKVELDAKVAQLETAKAQLDAATAERDTATEKLHQSAQQMKADGVPLERIAKYTGLTVAEIAALYRNGKKSD